MVLFNTEKVFSFSFLLILQKLSAVPRNFSNSVDRGGGGGYSVIFLVIRLSLFLQDPLWWNWILSAVVYGLSHMGITAL